MERGFALFILCSAWHIQEDSSSKHCRNHPQDIDDIGHFQEECEPLQEQVDRLQKTGKYDRPDEASTNVDASNPEELDSWGYRLDDSAYEEINMEALYPKSEEMSR